MSCFFHKSGFVLGTAGPLAESAGLGVATPGDGGVQCESAVHLGAARAWY